MAFSCLTHLFTFPPSTSTPNQQQQPKTLNDIPYSTWLPPTCARKCSGPCPHLPPPRAEIHGRGLASLTAAQPSPAPSQDGGVSTLDPPTGRIKVGDAHQTHVDRPDALKSPTCSHVDIDVDGDHDIDISPTAEAATDLSSDVKSDTTTTTTTTTATDTDADATLVRSD